ncbi:STT3 domain-containing protein [Hydrogenimonas sp.]
MKKRSLPANDTGTSALLAMMAVAYIFSLAVRMIWVYQMGDMEAFHWNGQLMINTNDGYFFGSGAQKELFGTLQHNPRVPDWLSYGVVFFTVLAAKFTPFSLDTIMLYMPAVVSSIVVVPIILIGRLYGSTLLGFFAALIGSIAWSYYNRTMVGYYDTDMFSAMMPMFILYFLLATIETEKPRYMLLAALTIAVYPFLYDSGLSLVYAMGLLYMGYMVLYHRKEKFTYESIILIAVALMGLSIWIKIAAIIILFLLFVRKGEMFEEKKLYIAAAAAVLLFLYTGNVFSLVWAKFSTYLFRGVEEGTGLKFFEVAQTVREAGQIPFDLMARRISGSVPGVIVALIGYLLLLLRHRSFILALPLIGIGIFSLWGGLRFTVYAVPVAAISAVYLFYVISEYIKNRVAGNLLIAALTAAMLYPNIYHIVEYKVPTVFSKPEVAALDRLSKRGDDKDYVITWWDYGYPIWYYADKNTLIDGGKHNHDNFIVSRILTTDSQLEAARLSRIAVETYVASGYRVVADTLFKNGEEGQIDPDEYLRRLRSEAVEMPKKTREVYLYLPYRMASIFPTVVVFSNIDLLTGEQKKRPMFYKTVNFKNRGDRVFLGNGIELDKRDGTLHLGNKSAQLKRFVTTVLDKTGNVSADVQLINPDARLSLIFLKNYQAFLILDEKMYQSVFVQLFVLGNYDESLFEPVLISPLVKIFRVKI